MAERTMKEIPKDKMPMRLPLQSGDEEFLKEFYSRLPKEVKKRVTPNIISTLHKLASNADFREEYRDSLVSYTSVLKEGRFKLHHYIIAVKYLTYRFQGYSVKASYIKTFPDRYDRLVANGVSENDISSYATAYNSGKLVMAIYEQSLVPSYILNADLFQKALNAQADLMMSAKSEKVRSDAANSLLTHLKRPEAQKIELDLGLKEDESIAALRESTLELVQQQKKMLEAGMMGIKEIASKEIVVEAIN